MLETIESTIRNTDKRSSGSNDSTDTINRRRESAKFLDANSEEDDDFTTHWSVQGKGNRKAQQRCWGFDTGETDYSIYDVAINGSALKVDKGRMEQEEQCLHGQHRKGRHIIAII